MTANYHTHTPRCGHAEGSEREYIEAAIEAGISELGFADHAPMPFSADLPMENLNRLHSMRMSLSQAEDYVNTLISLREEYKNDIKLYIGFEVEYFEDCFDSFTELIKDYPIEYLIMGQHFQRPSQKPVVYNGDVTRSKTVLTSYVDDVVAGIKTGKMTYIAHPDLIFFHGDLDCYEREMTRLINCANENKVPLEFNFLGLRYMRNYPTFAFWELASNIGCDVVFGYDAHSPKDLKEKKVLEYARGLIESKPKLNLLERVEFKPIK